MKKIIIGIIIGVVIGATATWLLMDTTKSQPAEPTSPEIGSHEPGLHLTRQQQAAAGLVIGKPVPTEFSAETKAFGRVLDVTPLATLMAEIETADSTAAASEKEWERLKSLGDNAAARTLETAEAAVKRDRAVANSAHWRLLAGWGKALAGRADLPALTHDLLAQQIALVRADLPAGERLDGTQVGVRVAPVTGEPGLQPAEWIGPAANTDPQAQGPSFLLLLRQDPPLPGTVLTVRFNKGAAAEKGFLLPPAAVVQYESGMFVFVQTGDELFERKPVEVGPLEREGIFIKSGLSAEDRVVMIGSQQLLSEEFKAANGGD